MLAKEQVFRGDGALEAHFADVIYVSAAAFDVLSRLALGLAESAVHQQLDERLAGTVEVGLPDFLRWHFADDVIEEIFRCLLNWSTEQDSARDSRARRSIRPMNDVCNLERQFDVRFARAGIFGVLSFQRFNFMLRLKREQLYVTDDIVTVSIVPGMR